MRMSEANESFDVGGQMAMNMEDDEETDALFKTIVIGDTAGVIDDVAIIIPDTLDLNFSCMLMFLILCFMCARLNSGSNISYVFSYVN